MKKIFLVAAVFLFFSPLVVRADTEDLRRDLDSAKRYASDAEVSAREASSTPVLEEAQYHARKAEAAAANAQKDIQAAMSTLD